MIEKGLPNELARLRKDVDEFKQAQLIGTSSVTGYTSESGDTWDWEGVITDTAFFNYQDLVFRFVADHQTAPFGKLRIVTDPAHPTGGNDGNIQVNIDQDYFYSNVAELRDNQMINFYVRITNNSGAPLAVKAKAYFDATDTGAVTVRAI